MWIEVFKAGEHTDASGQIHTFDTASLERIAERYNEHLQRKPASIAPIVKGHPQSDSPAYGWVERLARRGDKLLAKIKEIEHNFYDELKNGRYKKVSIALYPDLLLRHIGFLGASQPAVKDLALAKFDDSADYSEFENPMEGKNYNESQDNSSSNKSKILELVEQVDCYKSKLKFFEKEKRLEEYRKYIGNHFNGRKLTPAQIADVVDLLEMSYLVDEEAKQSGTFSENNSYENKMKRFVNFVLHQDITKELELISPKHSNKRDDFSGKYLYSNRLGIHKRAEEIMSENPGISYEEAVVMAFKENY